MERIILVISNDIEIFKTVREYLTVAYELIHAASGHTAFKIVHTMNPDLIIIKWPLTDMDGMTFLRRLKADKNISDTPVIIIDSPDQSPVPESVLNDWIIDYIKMPIDKGDLNRRIKMTLLLSESLKIAKYPRRNNVSDNLFSSSIIDFVPIPIFYQAADGSFLGCNKSFERFIKKTRTEIAGKTVFDIFSNPIAELFDKKFKTLIQKSGDTSFEIEMAQAQDENKCLIVSYSVFYTKGHTKPGGCIASITDITEIVKYAMFVRNQLEDFNVKSKEKYSQNIEKLQTELSTIQTEISTHLGLLMQAENEQDKILEEIDTLRPFLNNEGRMKLALLKQELNEENWLDFETRFNEINLSFFSHLQKRCPEITKNEKKLCAYLKMNLGAVEIAKMTNKSPNSINVAFARLRSKLNVHGNKELRMYLDEC